MKTICPACTCCCDDLVEGSTIGCAKGDAWLNRIATELPASVNGQPTELETAIEAAAEQLSSARFPLIAGLDGLTTQSQQIAFSISSKLGGVIDTTFNNTGRGGMFALQRHGKVTATLGEVSQRSDLVVFLFSDPELTHPRLIERYCKSAKQIVVVDNKETATAKVADHFIQVDKDSIYEFLAMIRMAIAEAGRFEIPDSISNLATKLTNAKYGACFYGHLNAVSEFGAATDALYLLTRQLNSKTRFTCLALRDDANALSAENVLAWSSGYPFAIRSQKMDLPEILDQTICNPTFNANEWSAEHVLSRGECDAALVCSTQSLDRLSGAARKHLEKVAAVFLVDEFGSGTGLGADATNFDATRSQIVIPTTTPGRTESGDWCRMDDVALPLKCPANDRTLRTNDVLTRLARSLN